MLFKKKFYWHRDRGEPTPIRPFSSARRIELVRRSPDWRWSDLFLTPLTRHWRPESTMTWNLQRTCVPSSLEREELARLTLRARLSRVSWNICIDLHGVRLRAVCPARGASCRPAVSTREGGTDPVAEANHGGTHGASPRATIFLFCI